MSERPMPKANAANTVPTKKVAIQMYRLSNT